MTIDQMSPVTKGELARLHPLSKRQFMAHANNQICMIAGHAENIVAGRGDAIEAALAIARIARKWHAELQALFADRAPDASLQKNPDRHIGAEYKP